MPRERRISVMSPEGQISVGGGPPPIAGLKPPAPMGSPTSSGFPNARRLDTLENKTIYLVDTGFGGSYLFMQQLQKWFSQNMPSVKTIRKRKPGGVFMDDNPVLWEEIQAKGDAVVLGVGG